MLKGLHLQSVTPVINPCSANSVSKSPTFTTEISWLLAGKKEPKSNQDGKNKFYPTFDEVTSWAKLWPKLLLTFSLGEWKTLTSTWCVKIQNPWRSMMSPVLWIICAAMVRSHLFLSGLAHLQQLSMCLQWQPTHNILVYIVPYAVQPQSPFGCQKRGNKMTASPLLHRKASFSLSVGL